MQQGWGELPRHEESGQSIWNEDLERRGMAVTPVVQTGPGVSIQSLSKLLWNVREDLCSRGAYSLAFDKPALAGMLMDVPVAELSVNRLPVPSGYMFWPFPESQLSHSCMKVFTAIWAQEVSHELRHLWEQSESYFPENQGKANPLIPD